MESSQNELIIESLEEVYAFNISFFSVLAFLVYDTGKFLYLLDSVILISNYY